MSIAQKSFREKCLLLTAPHLPAARNRRELNPAERSATYSSKSESSNASARQTNSTKNAERV
jgi:hypothetical protein